MTTLHVTNGTFPVLLQLKIQDRKGRQSETSGWCTSGIVAEKGSRRLKQLCR